MLDRTLETGYQNLLRENTRLHAEKRQIVDAADKAIRSATVSVDQLDALIHGVLRDCITIVEECLIESRIKDEIVKRFRAIEPLKIGAKPCDRTV